MGVLETWDPKQTGNLFFLGTYQIQRKRVFNISDSLKKELI